MLRNALMPPPPTNVSIMKHNDNVSAWQRSRELLSRLAKAGVTIHCRDKLGQLILGSDIRGLEKLMERASGLVLEIDQGFALSTKTLESVLALGLGQLQKIGDDLRSIRVHRQQANGRKVAVVPKTWSAVAAEERQSLDILGLKAALTGLLEVEKALGKAETVDAAEEAIAEILFRFFRVKAVKIYDVSEAGSVRVSHSFVPQAQAVARQERAAVKSHFATSIPPQNFKDEAMYEIITSHDSVPYVLVSSPESDPRCRRVVFDGESMIEQVIESSPFALIGERGKSGVHRVYKIDWETPEDLEIFSERAIDTIFKRLSAFKINFAMEAERKFLDNIEEISHSGESLEEILGKVSGEIANFISGSGQISAEKVTIMLFDRITKCLETRIIWNEGEIEQVAYFSGPGNRGVGRRFFDSDQAASLYLARLDDWSGQSVEWCNEGKGSLIAAKIGGQEDKLGVVFVSSSQEESFSVGQLEVLAQVSSRLSLAFERINQHLEELGFETKFGGRGSKKLRLFNPDCLQRKLHVDLKLAKNEGKKFSLIFLDIDDFKALNSVWIYEHVDKVLRQVFSRIINALRDDEEAEVYRDGGEEIIVRLSVGRQEATGLAERLRKIVAQEIKIAVSYPTLLEATQAMKTIEANKQIYSNSGITKVEVVAGRGKEGILIVKVQKTVSIGVTEALKPDTVESLKARVQQAGKDAKTKGKDQVVVL